MDDMQIARLKDETYKEMKDFDKTESLFSIRKRCKSIYRKEISEDYLKSLFANDNRFIFLNDTQIILKDTLNKIMENNFGNLSKVEEIVKNEYFIRDINRMTLLSLNNHSKKSEYYAVSIQFNDRTYEVNNIDDFFETLLVEGSISYNKLKIISDYLGIDYYETLKKAREMNVHIGKKDEIGKDCVVHAKSEYFNKNNVGSKRRHDKNILLLDMRTNEIVTCLVAIYVLQKNFNKVEKSWFSQKHLSGLYKMKIISDYKMEDELEITFLGEQLISKVEKFLLQFIHEEKLNQYFFAHAGTKELVKSKLIKEIDCDALWENLSLIFRQLYLQNPYAKSLFSLIAVANENEIYNLGDIILFLLDKNKQKEIKELFVGKTATSGYKPIKNNKDICLKCDGRKCMSKNKITKSKLLYYRDIYVNKFIDKINDDIQNINIIKDDPFIIKFIVPYNLCSRTKNILNTIKIIEKSRVFLKESGQYCPFFDKWVIYNDFLVR